jgi:drug/metabolite transporter (DMT)-like permease
MSVVAIALVLFSALLHASWNMLAKRSADPLAFIFGFNLISSILFAIPAGIMFVLHPVPAGGWPFMATTGTLHVFYMFLLAAAYRHGAFSLAYPVARGTGVFLVPILAIPIYGERPSIAGALGIFCVLAGLVTMAIPEKRVPGTAPGSRKGVLFAFLTGLAIAGYSLVDKGGVDRVHPVIYVYVIFLICTIGMAPYVVSRRREALAREWQENRPALLAGGVLPIATYLIVLLAMQIAAVSYVVPLRETSIVFGTLLGVLILKEQVTVRRTIASVAIAAGVLAIAIAG